MKYRLTPSLTINVVGTRRRMSVVLHSSLLAER